MSRKICKRIVDISLSSVGLIIAAPLLLLLAFLVWLDDPGPVLFAQTRLGVGGKPFRLLKFRKFAVNCSDAGPGVTTAGDVRMTAVGEILERTKMDELPQLWNILKGEMSFVGPRPESLRFADMFQGLHADLLNYLPGLFGPCQVAFRNESALYPADENPEAFYRRVLFPSKAELDLRYAQQASCLKDIGWIFRGLWTTVVGTADWKKVFTYYGVTIAIDSLISLTAWTVANILRFSWIPPLEEFPAFIYGLYVTPPVVVLGLIISGCYRNRLQGYFGFTDAIRFASAVTVSWVIAFLAILGFASRNISFYLLPLGLLVLLPALAIPRVWARLHSERKPNPGDWKSRIAIYGADRNGVAVANWVSNGDSGIKVSAFLDESPATRGNKLLGLPILRSETDLLTMNTESKMDEIWVARQLRAEQRTKIAAFCEQHDIRLVMLTDVEPFSRLALTA